MHEAAKTIPSLSEQAGDSRSYFPAFLPGK